MSLLVPSVQALDKGLNLQTAKLLAPPGSVLDSINYEQVDFQGQKRIDGYARYDGITLPALDDVYLIDQKDLTTAEYEDDAIYIDGKFLGVLLTYDDVNDTVAVWDHKLLDSLTHRSSKEFSADETAHYTSLLAYMAQLRARVGALPGAVSGLHWFNDRLYAISDLPVISVPSSTIIGVNDSLSVQMPNGSYDYREILAVEENKNDLAVFLDGGDIDEWKKHKITSAYVTYGGSSYPITIKSLSPEVDLDTYPASFYEARNEQQTRDEDGTYTVPTGGWLFNHQGWKVNFKDGNIPYGGFTALNQNKQGVGTQGPTSTAGNNGRPLALLQKVDITAYTQQVNGWKTSATPLSYNLDPLALSTNDTSYIYADSYMEFNGDTGSITTPDVSNVALTERPATSTVIVEV